MTLVVGINGSPRKGWNTSTLVGDALEGASSAGADTEMVNLYDLDFKGCVSCFGCKRVGLDDAKRVCYFKDGLSPVLDMVRGADALVIGSPIYFSQLTAGVAAFIERLYFPYTTYSSRPTFRTTPLPTAFIYTMNMGEGHIAEARPSFGRYEQFAGRILMCEPESYLSMDTLQYSDYSRYEHSFFDVDAKIEGRERRFPKDREACREIGRRLVSRAESLRGSAGTSE